MLTMSSTNLRLSAIPQVEISVRQCGRYPNRIVDTSVRASSAAHRAFHRAPGRPQTAAFAPLRSTGEPPRRSASADQTRLRDCITTHRASIEPRSDSSSLADDDDQSSTTSTAAATKINASKNKERDLSRRPRSLRQDKVKPSDQEIDTKKSNVGDDRIDWQKSSTTSRTKVKSRLRIVESSTVSRSTAVSTSTPSKLATLPPYGDVDRVTSGEEEMTSHGHRDSYKPITNARTGELMLPLESRDNPSMMSSGISSSSPKLVVYHFIGDPHGRSAARRDANGGRLASTVTLDLPNVDNEVDDVVTHEVDVQGADAKQNPAAGLSRDSSKNDALRDLLRRQVALNDRQHSTSDDSVIKEDVESLNVLVSQFINVRPTPGQLYYFACGPDTSTERFSKLIHRKPEDSSWALLYGFRLISGGTRRSASQGDEAWPHVEFLPQSAVHGRVYVITRDEAAMVDSFVNLTQGFQTVLLPVWLVENDDDECGTAEYCLPALVCVQPSRCL